MEVVGLVKDRLSQLISHLAGCLVLSKLILHEISLKHLNGSLLRTYQLIQTVFGVDQLFKVS